MTRYSYSNVAVEIFVEENGGPVARERANTVAALLKARKFRISKELQKILNNIAPTGYENEEKVANIGSYLLISTRLDKDWTGSIFNYENFNEYVIFPNERRLPASETLISAGLMEAFKDAADLCNLTSRKGGYIKPYHVLMAILTAPNERVRAERRQLLERTRTINEVNIWVGRCARNIFKFREPYEDLNRWISLLRVRPRSYL